MAGGERDLKSLENNLVRTLVIFKEWSTFIIR